MNELIVETEKCPENLIERKHRKLVAASIIISYANRKEMKNNEIGFIYILIRSFHHLISIGNYRTL